jgi:hypothetical protein
MISFHSRVKRAEEFSKDIHKVLGWIDEKYKPSGELKSDFVSGEMPTDKRRRKLAQLKNLQDNQRGLLSNARCLSEGVDVPSLDAVAFIDPRSSQIDIIQAVGRAIRLSKDKKAGTIVLPVFIGNTDDPEQALEEGNFKPIWDVLNALKAHDDVLADELNQIRTELGRKGGGKVDPNAFSKIFIDLPVRIDKSFGDGLRTLLVENSSASWEFSYGQLLRYVDNFGNAFVPTSYKTPDGFNLGGWVSHQRAYREQLAKERASKLELINGWVWEAMDAKWEIGYQHLQDYIKEFGNANVPNGYIPSDGYNLKIWISGQRENKSVLTAERLGRLNQIETWSWSPIDDLWNDGYKHLSEYSLTHGNLKMKKGYICEDGFKLSDWIGSQRKKRDLLCNERQRKLENIQGWSWSPISEQWENGLAQFKAYVEEHGHGNVPRSHKVIDGFNLSAWVGTQRWKRNEMTTERIKLLENTSGWTWDPMQDAWESSFNHLTNFVEIYGHSKVPQKFKTKDSYALGGWVSGQRNTKEAIPLELKDRLEKLAGWSWNLYDDIHWFEYYALLKEFFSIKNTSKVSWVYMTPNGYPLGKWVDIQRKSKHLLSEQKVNLLESLPNWFWVLPEATN